MDNPQSTIHNPQSTSNWRWWVCGAMLLATLLNYMDRQALAVVLPELKNTYHLGEKRIGLVEGCFGFAFALGSVIFGFLADRFGPRRLYPVVLLGWSLAGIATALAGEPWLTGYLETPDDEDGAGTFRWLLLCRTTLGLFEAGHWPCALITARQILTVKDRPLGNAILQSGAAVGAILIPLYVQVVEDCGGGWAFTFWSVGFAGLLWIPMWLLLVRGGDLAGAPPAPADGFTTVANGSGLARRLIALAVVVSSLTVSWQFLRAWLPLFLEDFRGFTKFNTRLVVSAYFIVADVGCILAGLLVKGLVARQWAVHTARMLSYAGFAGLTAVAAAAPLIHADWLLVTCLLIAGAGILGLHPYYYSLTQELPTKHVGILSGGLAAVGWITSSVFQILIGGYRIQETKSYDVGLVIAGLAPLVGLISLLLLWKGKNRREDPLTRSEEKTENSKSVKL